MDDTAGFFHGGPFHDDNKDSYVHPEDREENEQIKKLAEEGVMLVGGANSFNVTLLVSPTELFELTFGRSKGATPLSKNECLEEAKKVGFIVRKKNFRPSERPWKFVDAMSEKGFSFYGFRMIDMPPDIIKLF